jgi:hypothetical protein
VVIKLVPVVVLGVPVVTAGGVAELVERYTSAPAGAKPAGALHIMAAPVVVVPVYKCYRRSTAYRTTFTNLVRATFCALQAASACR